MGHDIDGWKQHDSGDEIAPAQAPVAPEDCRVCQGEGVLVGDACINGRDVDDVQLCYACQGGHEDRLDAYAEDRADDVLINPPPATFVADEIIAALRALQAVAA
jgi:hypothetical protein